QRHRTGLDHRIVEIAQVKPRAQFAFHSVAQAIDFGIAHLVATGLAGSRAIAVYLALHAGARPARGADDPVDGLVASPAHGVKPGVDHQPAGAELLRLQIAQFAEWVVLIH